MIIDASFKLSTYALVAVAAATATASSPVLPGGTTPVVDHLGALKVSRRIARSSTTRARSPVHLIDLPETSIIRAIGVLVASMRVTTRLMLNDALAAILVPTILRAPGGDINVSSAAADITVITGAVVGKGNSRKNEKEKPELHI